MLAWDRQGSFKMLCGERTQRLYRAEPVTPGGLPIPGLKACHLGHVWAVHTVSRIVSVPGVNGSVPCKWNLVSNTHQGEKESQAGRRRMCWWSWLNSRQLHWLNWVLFYLISDKEDFWESIFSFLSVPALKKKKRERERENTQKSPILWPAQFSGPC